MTLLGMDFIGPLPRERFPQPGDPPYSHIFHVIDYMSRYSWAFAVTSPSGEQARQCLDIIFDQVGSPVAIYSDEGTHFNSADTQAFLRARGVLWIGAPVAAKRSTGMVEKGNDILQRVLKKSTSSYINWPNHLAAAVFETNQREIEHLGYSPHEIFFGFQPAGWLETTFPSYRR